MDNTAAPTQSTVHCPFLVLGFSIEKKKEKG